MSGLRCSTNKFLKVLSGESHLSLPSAYFAQLVSLTRDRHIEAWPEVKVIIDELEKRHGKEQALQIAKTMSFEGVLGVKKWEVPFDAQGNILGEVPQFFPRPACERAQNISSLFTAKYLNTTFQITEKLDGVSMTTYCIIKDSKWNQSLPALPEGSTQETSALRLGVASAGQDLDERSNNAYWQAARHMGLPEKLREIGIRNVAVQGELVGSTIKENSLKFPDDAAHEFIVFQVFDIDRQEYINAAAVEKICANMGWSHVPVIAYMKLKDFARSLDELLLKAEGLGVYEQTREGFVFKSMHDDFVFKVISNKWLLEQGQ